MEAESITTKGPYQMGGERRESFGKGMQRGLVRDVWTNASRGEKGYEGL